MQCERDRQQGREDDPRVRRRARQVHRGPAARPNLTSVDTTDLAFLQEAAVPLGAETHAGEDVGIYARGPKAYLVRGTMEQNWIFHVMREAYGF